MPAYKDEDGRGTWFALFYYTDWTGAKRRKKKRGFERKKDALDFERDFLARMAKAPDMTFASLVELYNEDMKERIRETTRETNEVIVNRHILPFFGNMPLNEITPAHVRKWQSGLISKQRSTKQTTTTAAAKHYSPTYLKLVNGQLTTILNYATKYYGLPKNPCHAAGSMGKQHAGTMKFWTFEQFEKFIKCIDDPTARLGFLVLFWTGARIGELLALTESDFDFERGTVSVTKNYQTVKKKIIIHEPKTPKGKRIIPVPAVILGAIRDYVSGLSDYSPEDRLFPYTKKKFHAIKRKGVVASGVEDIRLHDFRHSHVALLIEMDVPILLISERLGHEDIQTTLRTYGHLYPNRHNDVAERLNKMATPLLSPETQRSGGTVLVPDGS